MSLKGLAKQVLEILEHGYYDADHGRVSIAKAQQNAVDGSCLYTPDKLLELRNVLSAGNAVPLVTVSEGTTQLVARGIQLVPSINRTKSRRFSLKRGRIRFPSIRVDDARVINRPFADTPSGG